MDTYCTVLMNAARFLDQKVRGVSIPAIQYRKPTRGYQRELGLYDTQGMVEKNKADIEVKSYKMYSSVVDPIQMNKKMLFICILGYYFVCVFFRYLSQVDIFIP